LELLGNAAKRLQAPHAFADEIRIQNFRKLRWKIKSSAQQIQSSPTAREFQYSKRLRPAPRQSRRDDAHEHARRGSNTRKPCQSTEAPSPLRQLREARITR